MFFMLSKVLWGLVQPETVFLLLLVGGTVLLWTGDRGRRLGRILLTAASAAAILVAVVPFGHVMTRMLENRFPPLARSELPDRIGGIIVLGGVVDQFVTRSRGQLSLNGAAERLTEFVRLAKRYPDAPLIFTGGSGQLFGQELKEADSVAEFVRDFGLDPGRIQFENQSRNTAENAVLSKTALDPRDGRPWILITSAFHMPRAVGCFRKEGWPLLPYPVDFVYAAEFNPQMGFNFAGGLANLGHAIHEWLGLFMYWMSGRTDSPFPGPQAVAAVARG